MFLLLLLLLLLLSPSLLLQRIVVLDRSPLSCFFCCISSMEVLDLHVSCAYVVSDGADYDFEVDTTIL